MNPTQFQQVLVYLQKLQDIICTELEKTETKGQFMQDSWQHAHGGGGRTRVMRGEVFESAGVNFSHVLGEKLPASATAQRPEMAGCGFEATGVSLVIHPRNPFVPTSHANVRAFRTTGRDKSQWWFGGGFDLTPFYPFDEDIIHWHTTAQNACLPFGEDVYGEYKRCCDEYFYLKHRQETRGVGGLFFDDLNQWGFDKCFAFIQAIGNAFIAAYIPIVKKRMHTPFSETHTAFQRYRRGRYVEFNLVYDRGTLFGLQSGGRTESILMSMPPEVSFRYNYQPAADSLEANLANYLQPRDWV